MLNKLFPLKPATNWLKNTQPKYPIGHDNNPYNAVHDVTEKDMAVTRYYVLKSCAAYGITPPNYKM